MNLIFFFYETRTGQLLRVTKYEFKDLRLTRRDELKIETVSFEVSLYLRGNITP